jgi:hypothetical protein
MKKGFVECKLESTNQGLELKKRKLEILEQWMSEMDQIIHILHNLPGEYNTTLELFKNDLKNECGLLPPKIAESDPWVMVCVDLVGPFTIKTPLKTHSLLALTSIDPAIV